MIQFDEREAAHKKPVQHLSHQQQEHPSSAGASSNDEEENASTQQENSKNADVGSPIIYEEQLTEKRVKMSKNKMQTMDTSGNESDSSTASSLTTSSLSSTVSTLSSSLYHHIVIACIH